MKFNRLDFLATIVTLAASPLAAQDRDTKVRGDRETIAANGGWVYNDLEAGRKLAALTDRPLLIVFRCIPCEACQEFDDDVARKDPAVRDLMDQFVCVRIIQANALDLTRFQHDFDQSFAITLMNPDGTLYGRFGTRSNRDDESKDISLEGLRRALAEALRMHDSYKAVKPSLAGKQVESARFETPLDYPSLAGRYEPKLDYEGAVAKSCVHCHQVGEAERRFFRDQSKPIPDEVLFPYPNPTVLGLTMDPKRMATVAEVVPGSTAEVDGFRAGDRIVKFDGQPMLSTADLQWVLHHAPAKGTIAAEVERAGQARKLTLTLDDGWRRRGDLSWRTTTWDLRRMGLGGMVLKPIAAEDRREAGVPEGRMALRVDHVGQYNDHAVAMRAGVQKGDLLVAFDGLDDFGSESEVLAYAVQQKRPGAEVVLTVLRDGRRLEMPIRLQ